MIRLLKSEIDALNHALSGCWSNVRGCLLVDKDLVLSKLESLRRSIHRIQEKTFASSELLLDDFKQFAKQVLLKAEF